MGLVCPALLICGEKDHAGSCIRYNKAWHKKTGIRLEWIKDAGHNAVHHAKCQLKGPGCTMPRRVPDKNVVFVFKVFNLLIEQPVISAVAKMLHNRDRNLASQENGTGISIFSMEIAIMDWPI